MEHCHDEEIKNAVLKDRSHQPGHARLTTVSFEFKDEDDDAGESNKIYKGVSFLDMCETVGNRYQRGQPVTCMPMHRP